MRALEVFSSFRTHAFMIQCAACVPVWTLQAQKRRSWRCLAHEQGELCVLIKVEMLLGPLVFRHADIPDTTCRKIACKKGTSAVR